MAAVNNVPKDLQGEFNGCRPLPARIRNVSNKSQNFQKVDNQLLSLDFFFFLKICQFVILLYLTF
jgi:hypothetical protein